MIEETEGPWRATGCWEGRHRFTWYKVSCISRQQAVPWEIHTSLKAIASNNCNCLESRTTSKTGAWAIYTTTYWSIESRVPPVVSQADETGPTNYSWITLCPIKKESEASVVNFRISWRLQTLSTVNYVSLFQNDQWVFLSLLFSGWIWMSNTKSKILLLCQV